MESMLGARRAHSAAAPASTHRTPTLAQALMARRTLGAGLALGIAGDLLLRRGIGGAGFTLFVLAIVAALVGLVRVRRARWTLGACLLLLPTLFFATAFAWRDSDALGFYNLLALLAALAALATALMRGEKWEPVAGVGAYLSGARRVTGSAAGGTGRLLREVGGLRSLASGNRLRGASAVGRGLAIALPLLLVFGSLLSAADPLFARLVHAVVDVDFASLTSHLVLTAGVAWVSAGYLRSALVFVPPADSPRAESGPALGIVEVGLVLASLDTLFVGFVAVQLRYLFGGSSRVATATGLTYAEYARSGFFELVWVAVLVLPVLLGADALLRRTRRRDEAIFRLLAGVLLALLGVVMLSAMQRMWLYQRAYGLTGTRFYASVAMGWLAFVFCWFAATVLRGRRAPFAFGALVSAWLAVAAIDVANPDALIARANLDRMRRGESFDVFHAMRLSADATPELLRGLRHMPEEEGCAVRRELLSRRNPQRDWRGWNLAHGRASRALAEHAGSLARLRCERFQRPLHTR